MRPQTVLLVAGGIFLLIVVVSATLAFFRVSLAPETPGQRLAKMVEEAEGLRVNTNDVFKVQTSGNREGKSNQGVQSGQVTVSDELIKLWFEERGDEYKKEFHDKFSSTGPWGTVEEKTNLLQEWERTVTITQSGEPGMVLALTSDENGEVRSRSWLLFLQYVRMERLPRAVEAYIDKKIIMGNTEKSIFEQLGPEGQLILNESEKTKKFIEENQLQLKESPLRTGFKFKL